MLLLQVYIISYRPAVKTTIFLENFLYCLSNTEITTPCKQPTAYGRNAIYLVCSYLPAYKGPHAGLPLAYPVELLTWLATGELSTNNQLNQIIKPPFYYSILFIIQFIIKVAIKTLPLAAPF